MIRIRQIRRTCKSLKTLNPSFKDIPVRRDIKGGRRSSRPQPAALREKPLSANRHIALLVFHGFQIQDLSGPLAAFEIAGTAAASEPYRLEIVSLDGGLVLSSSGLAVMSEKLQLRRYDTLIVVGGSLKVVEPSGLAAKLHQVIHRVAPKVRRVASVCTGAFILAGAGLLEGRLATTHWMYASHLQRLFPGIRVEGDRIFTKDGNIWTSAGITAGIDLALALIEDDLGTEISKSTAQMLVVYHRRPGGQSQFSALLEMEPQSDRMKKVLDYVREHLAEPLSLDGLARIAAVSTRQFGRIFAAETGETPAKAIERLRVESARPRIERGAEPIEGIAISVGFGDPERMRRAFLRVLGHPPQSFRRMALSHSHRA